MSLNGRSSCAGWVALLFVLAVLLQSSVSLVRGIDPSCVDHSSTIPDEINVGVLVWVDSDELILSRPISSYPPISTTSAAAKTSLPVVLQPFYLGIEFYKKRLAEATNSKIPVLGGTRHIALNISYINMGRIDWNKIAGGYPVDGQASIAAANRPGGLFDVLAFNSSSILGGNRTFTFFIPHPLMSSFALSLVNRIEDQRLAIMVHPFLSSAESFICDGRPAAVSVTADCVAPPYNRQRLLGARRFETLFSVLPDLANDAATTLSLYHTLGIRKIAIFREATVAAKTYSALAFQQAITYAEELNLQPLVTASLEVGQCPGSLSCPPASALATSQNQVWPANSTAMDWVVKMREKNIEAVMIIGTTGTGAAWSFGQLFYAMQEIDWTPKKLSWVGAFEKSGMSNYLPNGKADMLYTTGEIIWHRALRGAAFQTRSTSTNFELVESNATHAAPALYILQYDEMYGPDCTPGKCVPPATPGRAHPFWARNVDGGTMPALSYNAMMHVQKLIEASASSHVPAILNAASKVDVPSVFHRLGFDAYGRTKAFDVLVSEYYQVSANDDTKIISPFNIGVPSVYPMPTWSERTFTPQFYAESSERLMAAVTSVVIIAILCVFGSVMYHIKNPIIRATTPSFAALITGGAILMLVSNYFATLHTNSAHCSAQVWLLTTGFTMMLSSLFVKTFRIWRIFKKQKLTVIRIRDWDLFKVVLGFLLVDLILNITWQAADGMPAVLVIPDRLRPKYNYYQCDFSSDVAATFVFLHLAIKAGIVFFGILLTWAVRNVPSTFNDSLLLTGCIYNISFVACFVIPILATGVGGRQTTFLVRAFAIMFVALSTQLLLYAPKLYFISMSDSVMKLENATHLNMTHHVSASHEDSPKARSAARVTPLVVHSPVSKSNDQVHPVRSTAYLPNASPTSGGGGGETSPV